MRKVHARGCRVSTGTFRHAIGARVHGSLQAMTTAGYVSDGPYHFCYRGHAGCAPNGAQIIYRNEYLARALGALPLCIFFLMIYGR